MAGAGKAERRSQLLAARRAVPAEVRRAEAAQLRDHLKQLLTGTDTVAAYVPIGAEPGSPELLDLLEQHCRSVLLPVVRAGPDGEHLPLRWGRYVPGRLRAAARFGLQEPAEPGLPASALAQADVVLVPALAVDRRGVRLGRGGGFYDRSLVLCRPGARLVAVVRDCEVVEELPGEQHDVHMTHALTPSGGLIQLGNPAESAQQPDGVSST